MKLSLSRLYCNNFESFGFTVEQYPVKFARYRYNGFRADNVDIGVSL